jgi:hypothetical protein
MVQSISISVERSQTKESTGYIQWSISRGHPGRCFDASNHGLRKMNARGGEGVAWAGLEINKYNGWQPSNNGDANLRKSRQKR